MLISKLLINRKAFTLHEYLSMPNTTSSVYTRLAPPLLCFTLVIILLSVGQGVLKPICFAGLLAILLITPCRLFERAGFPRGIASLISLLLALMVFTVLFYFISNSIIQFRNDVPVLIERITETLTTLELWAQKKFDISPQKMKDIVESTRTSVTPSTTYIINTITSVSSTVFMSIIIAIYTFLLLLYRSLIVQFFVSLFAKQHSETVYSIVSKTRYVIKSYVVGLFIEILVVATANCTAFFLLGVKYAFLLGVIAAILNIVPYLGIFSACVLCTLITFTTDSASTVAGVIISLIIIHMIDSNILMAKIVGSKVKLNALATIIGVVFFSAVWGILGTFLAIPIMAILKVIFDDVEAFHPFSIIMGDDASVKSASKPVFKKIAATVRRTTKK
jgi:predicted PurR-regulated permease PerM